jgi:nucleoside-diphosphate-sugar epimerase
MKNIIIIGSSGFIGRHYKDYLSSDSQVRVIEFDLQRNQQEDIRKGIFINDDFGRDDIIINLAAVHKTPGHPDHEYFETNILGAEKVCEFAEKSGIDNIIFTSSIAPYGASNDLKKEEILPTPNTPYGISKLVAEYIHKTWQAKDPKNRRLLILRPGVVFGEGENGNFTRLYKALKNNSFFYPGRKDTIKACIYVKDLIKLSFDILESKQGGVETYNLSYEPAPSIEEIVEAICEIAGIKPPKLIINGKILKGVAFLLSIIGFHKSGIHPERVKKLMISTNISGQKVLETGFSFKYSLDSAIGDWYDDCNQEGLF